MIQIILIVALAILFFYLLGEVKELKRKLDYSNKRADNLFNDVVVLERRIMTFKHETKNPFKYQNGDRVDKDWVVSASYIFEHNNCGVTSFMNGYDLTNVKTGEKKSIVDEENKTTWK